MTQPDPEWVRTASLAQLRSLSSMISAEIMKRAVDSNDPDLLVALAMRERFDSSGVPMAPHMVTDGLVIIPGSVRDGKSGKHSCTLYTVQLPNGDTPIWCWEGGTETFVHGDSEKVGGIRRSIALHIALPGLEIARHEMQHDGTRHARTSSRAWTVTQDEDGTMSLVQLRSYTPTHLPPPEGEVDSRAYGGAR